MYWLFDLEKVPDLSLTKYMSLDESGVNGVISKHLSFLRQLNRKGILSRVFFHLFYSYDPNKDKGKKLSISMLAEGSEEALFHTKELIQNSAISPFYNIISNEKCFITSIKKNATNEIVVTVKNHLGFLSNYTFTHNCSCKGDYFSKKEEKCYFSEVISASIPFSIKVSDSRLVEINSDVFSDDEKCFITSIRKNNDNEIVITIKNKSGIESDYIYTNKCHCKGGYFLEKKEKCYFSEVIVDSLPFSIRVLGSQLLEIDSNNPVCDTGLKTPKTNYSYQSVLSKREFFVQPSIILPDDNDLKYYKVSEWEISNSARLYNMLKLMEGLNSPVTYRVDLFAVDYAMRLREVLPIKELRARTSMKATKTNTSVTVNKDDNADETLKHYNEMIEKFENSPHFRVNIVAFANAKDVSELIVDAAGAEALESGSYNIDTEESKNGFNAFSQMGKPIDVALPDVVSYLRFMPNLFSLEEVQPFFIFPALYDGESIEIAKETAPSYEKNGMKIAVDENGYEVIFPVSLFKKHAFLAGVPGSGKTNSMLHLTSSLWKKHKIPFLIFEPAKQEYRALALTEGMEDLLIFSPSSGTLFPLHINPFQFPIGMSLSEHIRNLMAVFEGAFSLAPPAPFMIDYSIESIYREKGWYPDTINDGKSLPYPTMRDLYDRLEIEVEKTDYEGEIKGNLKSILQVRIGSLLRREMGDVFNVPKSSMAPEEWLNRPALIELEAMGSGPANFLSLLLSTLIRETLKITPNADGKELRHVIFFEEAHNLIGPVAQEVTGEDADPKMAATAFVVKMLAEVRALREGIVIADQLPTVMAPEVIKNTGLKIGHRITAEDDRSLLGSTMSANGTQLEQMATFLPGEALITFEGLLRPFKAQFCQWENGTASYESPSNEELSKKMWNYPGYKCVLSRSANISCKKFEDEFHRLNERFLNLVASNRSITEDIQKLMKFKVDNNLADADIYEDDEPKNPLIRRVQDESFAVQRRVNALKKSVLELNSDIEELLVKEKGYFNQNRMYRKRTGADILDAIALRKGVCKSMEKRVPFIRTRFNEFTKEVESWRIKSMLTDLFGS